MGSDEILNNNDVNSSYKKFIEMFRNIYEVSFPVRTISRKDKRQHKPWMTSDSKMHVKKEYTLQTFPKNKKRCC